MQSIKPSVSRIVLAVAGIAFGVGLMSMAAVSATYSWRLAAVHDAHRAEVTSQERRHSREKTEMRKGISERLDKLKDQRCQ